MLMASSVLAACSKSNDTSEPSPSSSGSGAPTSEPSASASASASPSESAQALKGTINISLPNASSSVWNAVAQGYMAKNPGVKVTVDNKPLEGYKEWLTAQFAAGTPDVDMVVNNEVAGLMNDRKFMDYYPYFDKQNPYTNKPWKDSFDLSAMGINLDGVGPEDYLYNLNFESVQIVWVYNKEIFQKVGIAQTPKTFDEMMNDFKKIKEAGYTPLALAGNSNSMWSGQAGWLVRIYADQYLRDYINIARSQEQDYTYLPEVDGTWKYDLNDPFNDANSKVTKNELRQLKAIKDKAGPYKIEGNPKWAAYADNLKRLFQYVPSGFFGVKDDQAYNLFLTGKAATMMSTPASYWQLPKDFADESKTGAKGGVKPFEYGFYNMPSMEGPEVMAPARTIQIPIGFYGFVNKNAEQNALNADFMMYLTSPEGYAVYVKAIQASSDASLSGAPALKDITLPPEMTKAFADFSPIGNTEGYQSPGNSLARGLMDYQPSVQDWVGSVQRFFDGKLTTEQYLKELQANVDKYFVPMLKQGKKELSDLDTPERRPPERK
ncbi:ABC transporter substrate-binding protein [Cohnella nanjingensis]|uniref:Extracellular solute-binding protein n=1 Tax=Cohnella nanjingensis TaxID=1387779 RepID=A0A7X0VFW1_9BACL|nr:extracellular solute-binding protein [Cohnella nanjingensis]MBB6672490.1 extracellular solute-binding protein [Cohnella nanjingensis]